VRLWNGFGTCLNRLVVMTVLCGRYNVTPEELGAVLRADSRVNAYALFVAEQNAAEWLAKELPFGHGFVCLDTGKLPTTFKEILAHASNVADS